MRLLHGPFLMLAGRWPVKAAVQNTDGSIYRHCIPPGATYAYVVKRAYAPRRIVGTLTLRGNNVT